MLESKDMRQLFVMALQQLEGAACLQIVNERPLFSSPLFSSQHLPTHLAIDRLLRSRSKLTSCEVMFFTGSYRVGFARL